MMFWRYSLTLFVSSTTIAFGEELAPYGYAVVASQRPVYGLTKFKDEKSKVEWSDDEISTFWPPYGRVMRLNGPMITSEENYGLGDNYPVTLDNGKGQDVQGYIHHDYIKRFKSLTDAEDFAESLYENLDENDPVKFLQPSLEEALKSSRRSHESIFLEREEATLAPSTAIMIRSSFDEVSETFSNIKNKLFKELRRTESGSQLLKKLKRNFSPTKSDRIAIIQAAEKALSPEERALFGLVATAWAEERKTVGKHNCSGIDKNSSLEKLKACREDPIGRANMVFTMKIIENRSQKGPAYQQFLAPEYRGDDTLTPADRIWKVITKNRAFSSWNIDSKNFGNTLTAIFDPDKMSTSEKVALDRALAAYRDFSSRKVTYLGFKSPDKGTPATLMMNRWEVQETESGRFPVSWSIEKIMEKIYEGKLPKTVPHEVGLRVPKEVYGGIRLPVSDDSLETRVIGFNDMGHWPVYLKKLKFDEMPMARKKQGKW